MSDFNSNYCEPLQTSWANSFPNEHQESTTEDKSLKDRVISLQASLLFSKFSTMYKLYFTSITQKALLFWKEHFAVEENADQREKK